MSEIRMQEKAIITDLPPAGKLSLAIDESDGQLYTIDSAGVVTKYFSPTTDSCRIGFADYNDSGVSTNLVAGVPLTLTNDEAGSFTNKTYLPTGVTDVWDTGTGLFDWSELKLGDMVDIRIDLFLTTTSVNTSVNVDLNLGTGAGSYVIPFVTDNDYKAAGSHEIIVYNGIYMGDANTLDNGGYFTMTSDKNASIIVNGWYCKILIRG